MHTNSGWKFHRRTIEQSSSTRISSWAWFAWSFPGTRSIYSTNLYDKCQTTTERKLLWNISGGGIRWATSQHSLWSTWETGQIWCMHSKRSHCTLQWIHHIPWSKCDPLIAVQWHYWQSWLNWRDTKPNISSNYFWMIQSLNVFIMPPWRPGGNSIEDHHKACFRKQKCDMWCVAWHIKQ